MNKATKNLNFGALSAPKLSTERTISTSTSTHIELPNPRSYDEEPELVHRALLNPGQGSAHDVPFASGLAESEIDPTSDRDLVYQSEVPTAQQISANTTIGFTGLQSTPSDLQITQQESTYYPQSDLDQTATLSTFDWNANITSTINWLQPDSFNLDDADLGTLFPIFPENYYFSPSVDFVSPTQHTQVDVSGTVLDSSVSVYQETPQPSTVILDAQRIPTPESVPPPTGCGEYYVDGDAGRLPKSKRRRVVAKPRILTDLDDSSFSLSYTPPMITGTPPRRGLSEDAYTNLDFLYRQLCLDTTIFKKYAPSAFPPRSALANLLSLYFVHFDRTMPSIHPASFKPEKEHCALLLAMMALGSCYADFDPSGQFALSMHEFVRRFLVFIQEQRQWYPDDPATLAQVHVLHAIGARYTLYEPLQTSSSLSLHAATEFCRTSWRTQERTKALTSCGWYTWIANEKATRLGYCIWLLDAMWASQFQQSPHLRLDDATHLQLPCPDRLWAAADASEFDQLRTTSGLSDPPTLGEALQSLYIDKQLLPNLGELSRVILIHGIIHRTWEVKTTVTQSFSRFEPSALKQTSNEVNHAEPVWPPAVPLFNKWRNSACDCLDILHWSANAAIGAASGMEHPTVLHLHLARIVLLAPLEDILLFSHYLIRSSRESNRVFPHVSAAEAEAHRRRIQRWAVQDQYKARLAAIHAGAVLWHVRLYSIDAFYEPTAVALAALMFWALSAFSINKTRTRPNSRGGARGRSDPSDGGCSPSPDVCDIILIDRPTDDELVQQFVRQGDSMRANMTGVGDVFGPRGPRKVLAEGQKLILSLGGWRGISNYWVKVLNRLEKVTAMAGVDTESV
ncbi:hypothetical protein H2204_014693 [Knufia peltigerae]|uniref:Xylanolytic transcriptional activator regulatory domain-containing protein n=1 Tax=Knufia peltigerae TaxID=1002370 RepID=A0AA39CLL9_9EURO|nr:hypothetical protein H2204_014693 [Knufia peltigerae]